MEIIENENDFGKALKELDHRCNIERTLIQPLVKNSSDFMSGIMNLTKSLRNLYTHAYQSYLWNYVASRRINLHGTKICKIRSCRRLC